MQQLNFVSIKLTLWVILGIVIGFYADVAPLVPLACLVLLLPVLFWTGKRQPREGVPYFELATMATSLCLGIFVVGMATSNGMPRHYSGQELAKENLWHLKVREVLKPNPYTQRYIAQVNSVGDNKKQGYMLLVLPSDSTRAKFRVDDEVFVLSRPETIQPPLNPHQFNYKDYLKKQGIHHQIRSNRESIVIKKNPSPTLLGRAQGFREHIISKLKKENFGDDELAVIQALLLGQRDDISESTYENYKNAGAVHILAVSGLHVGILLLLLQFLLTPLERLPKGKTLKLVLIVLLLWTYAFVAGLSPSIVRAVTMFSFLAYSMSLNRPTNSFNIIALSMLSILLVKSLFLFQVGFQMSYAAVFAIVWIYPKLQRFWFPENIVIRKTWQLFSVSVAAQLGVLPISLFHFHQFPVLFFVSNLLIIPFLGLILGLGILVIALALADLLPRFLVVGFNWTIQTMNSIVGWVARQEGFIIKDIPFDAVQLVLGYFIAITLVIYLSRPKWKMALMLFGGMMAFQAWNIWNETQLHQKETLVLAHKSQNTVLLHQTGRNLIILSSDTTNLGSVAQDYAVAERIQNISLSPLKKIYMIDQKKLYIMDSLGLFPLEKQPDYVLLTQSPKINLGRLLDSIGPKMILADGSNYRNMVHQWQRTCAQKEIPFHYTGEKGFYVFDMEED
ncbi:competence protein ComEC [Flagellimonas taeanensis]|uniref:Competence protein ComEC n=1 Tax=Flagellimonas taeanensis TaxID=1005926 RepID=A0A1M6P9W9_9FLAO|nr:competence protein ComEC [Allomuricauda taeanensis]SHK04749.1 competence protein ComEC [Allomuricauda taeanensis]